MQEIGFFFKWMKLEYVATGVGFAVKPSAASGLSQFFAESVARLKCRIQGEIGCESPVNLTGDSSRTGVSPLGSAASASLNPFQGHCPGFASSQL